MPGNNNDCISKCNEITKQENCNYAFKDEETLIDCFWDVVGSEGKKCVAIRPDEIKSCNDAKNAFDMTNEQ